MHLRAMHLRAILLRRVCPARAKKCAEVENTQKIRSNKTSAIEHLAQGRFTLETLRPALRSRATTDARSSTFARLYLQVVPRCPTPAT